MSKLFDSISHIRFEPVNSGQSKEGPFMALGMWARDGEYVAFSRPVDCTGQVELWLEAIVDAMQCSLRNLLQEAVSVYEEQPKEQWIYRFPSQVALTMSQIAWNAEVTAAFDRQEHGYEFALRDLHKKQVHTHRSVGSILFLLLPLHCCQINILLIMKII